MVGLRQRSGLGRPGKRVRKDLRSEARSALRHSAPMVATVFLGYAVIGGILVWALVSLGHSYFAVFIAGLLVGGAPRLWDAFLLSRGIAQRQMGGDAEEWTATELRKLDRRWSVFHDVPVGRGNVDHVVVGPGRVYAVETKWTGSGGRTRYLRPAARQAGRQARALASQLRQRGCRDEVIPLLVIWGAGVGDALGAQPQLWEGTRVVAGAHSDVWLERMSAAATRRSQNLEGQQAVKRIVELSA